MGSNVVVVGANTYELIRSVAIVRPLGTPALKGKSQPVEVYELLGLRDEVGEVDEVDALTGGANVIARH